MHKEAQAIDRFPSGMPEQAKRMVILHRVDAIIHASNERVRAHHSNAADLLVREWSPARETSRRLMEGGE